MLNWGFCGDAEPKSRWADMKVYEVSCLGVIQKSGPFRASVQWEMQSMTSLVMSYFVLLCQETTPLACTFSSTWSHTTQ